MSANAYKQEEVLKEWNEKGAAYARAINEMVAFGEEFGYDNWTEPEAVDEREHLAETVIRLLKAANEKGMTTDFRKDFPPAHAPLMNYLETQGQSIDDIHYISGEKIVFLTGSPYQDRQAYLLEEDRLITLDKGIRAIGKSKAGNVFALATGNTITTTDGWQGDIIAEFTLAKTAEMQITSLTPFNTGRKLLLVSTSGIFIIDENKEEQIHPVYGPEDEDAPYDIDMENATLSNQNEYIVVGDQGSNHRILTAEGRETGDIGPQSSYPHFCLFSKDDSQLITNSCHFYNGVTIGVATSRLEGLAIEAYTERDEYTVLDEGMRVYCGLATSDYYILGEAYGYIKAIDKEGNKLWQHFLGSSISSMALSDDEQTLWVGSYSGMLHKLRLHAGQDAHTIGTGNHRELFRILFWINEPRPLLW